MGVGISQPPRLTVNPDTGEPIRYKVRFRDRDTLEAARAVETPLLAVPVENEQRQFISVQARPVRARGAEAELPSMDELLQVYETDFGADICASLE
jgi:hypothetical protein